VIRTIARLRVLLVRLGFSVGRRTAIRSRVVLATSHADTIGGNLAAIRDGLAAREPRTSVVILSRRPRPGWAGALAMARDHIAAGWHLATARLFVVDDYYFPMYVVHPREGTRYVQVWHACGAFKKFGYSVLDKGFGADESLVAEVSIHTNYDLCLVSAARFAPFYAEAFRQPLARFSSRLGIPRTDLFFDEHRRAEAARAVRARYAIPSGKRVILYAPTFRGTRTTHARTPENLDLAVLRRMLGSDHVLLVRGHPFVASRLRVGADFAGFAIDVSDWPEMNELLIVSDVLVTDYSSAIFEFALLGRPIAVFAPDRRDYEGERGFYLDFPADLPGPAFETTAALAGYLRDGPFDLDRVRRFGAASFDVADGRATARFVEEVVRPALRGS
jgi:CDP-ribitol ribitolphosphotransferase